MIIQSITFCIHPTKDVIMHSGMHYTHARTFDTCMMPDIEHMDIFVHYAI